MFVIDFSIAVAILLIILLGILLGLGVRNIKHTDKDFTLDPKYMWYCTVCTYTYINTKEDVISTCPRCGSYNKKES